MSLGSLVEEEGEDWPVEAQEDFPPPRRWQQSHCAVPSHDRLIDTLTVTVTVTVTVTRGSHRGTRPTLHFEGSFSVPNSRSPNIHTQMPMPKSSF
eukprot:scaffold1236_cov170-Ochromonas_danica.AAC.11